MLGELVRTEFKLRYQGSVLGYLWSLLKPLFLFAIMYVVFVRFLRFGDGIPHFPIQLLLGIVLWGFFAEITNYGMTSIVGRGDLIRKISFPKYIIVLSGTVSALINLGFNLAVVGIFMLVDGVDLHRTAVLFPLNVLEIYIFAVAMAFLLAALYVKLRDLSHIWEVIMQAAFYATPVIYPLILLIQQQQVLAAKFILLSPVAQAMQDARYNLITHDKTIRIYDLIHNPVILAIPFIIVAGASILAIWYFRKESKHFAENI